MMKRILFLVVLLVAVSVVSTGCFFSSSTATEEAKVHLDLSIQGEGMVHSLSEGNNQLEEGTVVDLTAQPDDGWEFKQWKGDVRNKYSSSTSILMSSNKDVTAVFERKEDPVQDVSFQSERTGTREYQLTATKPADGKYWEWKFPDLSYWRGKVDDNQIEHKFSSSGTKKVILEIYDEDENKIGRYEKNIDVH